MGTATGQVASIIIIGTFCLLGTAPAILGSLSLSYRSKRPFYEAVNLFTTKCLVELSLFSNEKFNLNLIFFFTLNPKRQCITYAYFFQLSTSMTTKVSNNQHFANTIRLIIKKFRHYFINLDWLFMLDHFAECGSPVQPARFIQLQEDQPLTKSTL